MNVDRMRKYLAKKFPDEIRIVILPTYIMLEEDWAHACHDELALFQKRMKLKYSRGDYRIDVQMTEDCEYMTRVVKARVVKNAVRS